MNRKVSISGGLALMLIINAVHGNIIDDKCATFEENCDKDHKNSCCDESLKCSWSESVTEYQCIRRAQLGDNCLTNEDCSDVLHSTCSSGTCVCRQNNVQVDNTTCMPLLNEFCWKESCAPDNSVCADNECQCMGGFSALGNDQCVQNVMLGAPCNDDAACKEITFAECSSNGTCTCSAKTVMMGPKLCLLLLGEPCESNYECGVNSECIDHKCQCRYQYIAALNANCKKAYLGMPCNDTNYCQSYIVNAECAMNKCLPNLYYDPRKTNFRLIESHCESNSDCTLEHSNCIDNECQCKPGYRLQESKCLPKYLEGSCRVTSDCIDIKAAVCKSNVCTCDSGFFPVNRTMCSGGLGIICSRDDECIVKNSQCIEGRCKCRSGYRWGSGKNCLPTFLHGFCYEDNQCRLIPNSQCSRDNQCICRDNHAQQNISACAPLLNEHCSITNQCVTENSLCIDDVCQCRYGYSRKSNNQCIHPYPEKNCVVDADCSDITNAKCSHEKKCDCKSNYVRSEQFRCSLILEAYCKQDGDCVTKNSTCFDNECKCPKGYFQVLEGLCARIFLGQYCRGNDDCNTITNGRCSDDDICVCKSGYSKFDRSVCLPLIGERCDEHKECFIYNSNCVGNQCQCLENYAPMSNTKCLSRYLDIPCLIDFDCHVVLNSRCSRFNRCICNHNYIVTEKGVCGPTLDGGCSESWSCVTSYSDCVDNQCQCKPNFVRGMYNNCVPSYLEGYCADDNDCAELRHSQCKGNKCVCRNNYVMVNNTKCQPQLNSFCDTDNDCIVEDSDCVNNRCQCKVSYTTQLPNRCEPISLGKPCKTDLSCSLIEKGTCSADKICACSKDSFAMDEMTCAPLLNTFCWFDDCEIESSDCILHKCQCNSGYSAISSFQCMKTDLIFSCENDSDCLEPWHFRCSNEKKCVCKDNNVAINNSTCMPLLTGACWQDDQCKTDNSHCVDYHCQCKPNFIRIAPNACLPKI